MATVSPAYLDNWLSHFPSAMPLQQQVLTLAWQLDVMCYLNFHPQTPLDQEKVQLLNQIGPWLNQLQEQGKDPRLISLGYAVAQVAPILPDCTLLQNIQKLFLDLQNGNPCDGGLLVQMCFEVAKYQQIYTMRTTKFLSTRGATEKRKTTANTSKYRKEILPIFEQIRQQERSKPELKGRNSPFAIVFESSIRPILEENHVWQPRIHLFEGDEIEETPGEMRERLYKEIFKAYTQWKKDHLSGYEQFQKMALEYGKAVWQPVNSELETFENMWKCKKPLDKKQLVDLRNDLLGMLESAECEHV